MAFLFPVFRQPQINPSSPTASEPLRWISSFVTIMPFWGAMVENQITIYPQVIKRGLLENPYDAQTLMENFPKNRPEEKLPGWVVNFHR